MRSTTLLAEDATYHAERTSNWGESFTNCKAETLLLGSGAVCIISRHRIHEMRTIVIDDPGVCQSVCYAVSLFAVETAVDQRNIVLDGSIDFSHRFDAACAK